MLEYALVYRGKKRPFVTPPIIKQRIQFGGDPVWVDASVAKTLMQLNPVMFDKVGERDTELVIDNVEDIVVKPELPEPEIEVPNFICEKCGKDYRVERFYLKHIATCEGPENDE